MNREEQRKKYLKPFTTDRPEACTAQINVRIAPSVKKKLKQVDGWHERVRELLDELTESIEVA